jgi:hypothetical protein
MSKFDRISVLVAAFACHTALATPAVAQARGPSPGEVESDPIRCWWNVDTPSVHVGQQFTLKLTCAVVDTTRLKVVPVANQFEPTAMQVAPFEVLGGTRYEDIQAPPWRYFQSEYTLRLVGDKYFGQDIDIPSIKITYNLQFPNNGGSQGRDLSYVLPPIPVRIMSLVPKLAADIRDAPGASFGDAEARRFRSTTEIVAAALAFGFAIVLVGLAVANAIGHYRGRVPVAARPLPARTILAACLRELNRVAQEAHGGWTPELAARALTAFRIAAAVALGRPVAQTIVDRTTKERPGQIVLPKSVLGRKRAVVSASTTTNLIDRQLASQNGGHATGRQDATLDDIRESLRTFSEARYGRNGHLDRTALDKAIARGTSAVRRLRLRKLWRAPSTRALTQSAASL